MKEPTQPAVDLTTLTREQRSLYERLLEREQAAGADSGERAHSRSDTEDPIPMSYSQQRMWFLEQRIDVNHAYTIAWIFRLEGNLDLPALEAAYNYILDRHEVLRITCRTVNNAPVQEILPSQHHPIPVTDVSDLPDESRASVADRVTHQMAGKAYDLSTGPLFMMDLLKIAPDVHHLIIRGHHYVLDSWSADILLEETGMFYGDFKQKREPQAPPLKLRYSEFARQEIARTKSDLASRQLNYWKKALKDAPPRLDLQQRSARPESLHYEGAKHYFRIEGDRSNPFRKFCQEEGVTLFMGMQAVFQTLLHRYTGQERIVVGIAISNRFTKDTERMVGSFANTLAQCVPFTGDPSFRDLLRRVRRVNYEAMANADVPFDRVVREINPNRSANYDPIVQVMFMVHNRPQQEVLLLDELDVTRLRVEKGGSRMDLIFELVAADDHFLCWFEYRKDLFDRQAMARMDQHFQTLFDSILAEPDRPLSQLQILMRPELAGLPDASIGEDRESFSPERRHLLFGPNLLPPRSNPTLVEALQGLWCQPLGKSDIEPGEDLGTLGAEAPMYEVICEAVNTACGLDLSGARFAKNQTAAAQAALIQNAILSKAEGMTDSDALVELTTLCKNGSEAVFAP